MSDLRERLIEALPHLGLGRTDWEGDQIVDALLPIIEAGLQKRDKEIERLDWVRKDHWTKVQNWSDRALKAETALTEANKFLEQTIEVLEMLSKVSSGGTGRVWDIPPDDRLSIGEWHRVYAKPLLDNLKALKKEGTE